MPISFSEQFTTALVRLIIAAVILTSSGCSTLGATFWGRPVIKDSPAGFDTLSLTADRRIAIFRINKKEDVGEKACAEALPDVAISSDVESSLKVALNKAEVEGNVEAAEKLKQAITIAYQRTEKSDLVRQLGWQICQGHLNGAIGEKEYLRLLETMVIASLVNTDSEDGTGVSSLKALLPD